MPIRTFFSSRGYAMGMGSLDSLKNDEGVFNGVWLQIPMDWVILELLARPIQNALQWSTSMIWSIGDIFISEVMHSPKAVSDYKGWFGIYNSLDTRVNLKGLQIFF